MSVSLFASVILLNGCALFESKSVVVLDRKSLSNGGEAALRVRASGNVLTGKTTRHWAIVDSDRVLVEIEATDQIASDGSNPVELMIVPNTDRVFVFNTQTKLPVLAADLANGNVWTSPNMPPWTAFYGVIH